MRKKIIIFLLLACIFMASIAFGNANRIQIFKDVSQSHWAYDSIVEMKHKGLIKGYEDGTFKPDSIVTREEFAQMV